MFKKIVLAGIIGLASCPTLASSPPEKNNESMQERSPRLERLKAMATLPPEIQFPVTTRATDLFTTLTEDNKETIASLAGVIAKWPATDAPTIHVLTPEAFTPLQGQAKSKVAESIRQLKKQLQRDKVREGLVVIHDHPYLQYLWPADLGTFFWYQDGKATSKKENKDTPPTWKLGFLDVNKANHELSGEEWPLDSKSIFTKELPLEEPQLMVDTLKQILNFDILRFPVQKRDYEVDQANPHGEDLEILPDGTFVTSRQTSASYQQWLEKVSRQPLIKIATDYLQFPHVSQVFAVLPDGKAVTPSCAWTLAAASPLQGLRIRKSEIIRRHGRDEGMTESLLYFAKKNGLKLDQKITIQDFDVDRELRRYRASEADENGTGHLRRMDIVVKKNLLAESEIERGIMAIKERFPSSSKCPLSQVVRIPVFTQIPEPEDFEDEDEFAQTVRLQVEAPRVGGVAVNGHILISDFNDIPKPFRSSFENEFHEALNLAKIDKTKIHTLATRPLSENQGTLRGAILVLRQPIPSATP